MHRAWVLGAFLGIGAWATVGAALGVTNSGTTANESEALRAPVITGYSTMCNASAAVSVGKGLFVVADDEDKKSTKLRLYRIGQAGEPLSKEAINEDFLGLEDDGLEVDLEGAAEVDDRVYWIGSHSADKEGKAMRNRRRLFAIKLSVQNGKDLKIKEIDQPYRHLISDLHEDDNYRPFNLIDAARKDSKSDGALSIEGLASTPDGDLLIGFRNPIIQGRALVARLKNPKGVMKNEFGKFAKPILLDLGGLGIRSMERKGDKYYIIAGRFDGNPDFKLFRWSGEPHQAPELVPGITFPDLNPEALFFEGTDGYILSDDGKREIAGKSCEKLDKELRLFRGFGFKP